MATDVIAPTTESRAARTIREVFESGRPLTYVRSPEEQRVGRVLREVAARLGRRPSRCGPGASPKACAAKAKSRQPGTERPAGARFYRALPGPAIFHLKDFHEALRESAEIRRRLRDVYEVCLDQRSSS